MVYLKDFISFNQYIGLAEPLDNDIDVGYYDPPSIVLTSQPMTVDFYRISIKINYRSRSTPNAERVSAVFFNTPDLVIAPGWDAEPDYKGMYLHLSKKVIDENRFLFKTYLDYGQHEALQLNDDEIREISAVFELMITYYESGIKDFSVLLSYANVLICLVEAFYKRQFSTNPKQYSPIVTDFQQSLIDYYNKPVTQLPTVQYFADKLGVTANYLGDIIKHFTQKSAIENIHEFVIKKAKELIEQNDAMNNSEIAYELGFEYPNYFAKVFKKVTGVSPKEYRLQFNKVI